MTSPKAVSVTTTEATPSNITGHGAHDLGEKHGRGRYVSTAWRADALRTLHRHPHELPSAAGHAPQHAALLNQPYLARCTDSLSPQAMHPAHPVHPRAPTSALAAAHMRPSPPCGLPLAVGSEPQHIAQYYVHRSTRTLSRSSTRASLSSSSSKKKH